MAANTNGISNGSNNSNNSNNNHGTSISSNDLETMKNDIVNELRREIQSAKREIIDGLFHIYSHT